MLARLGLCTLVLASPLGVAAADSANIPTLVQKAKPAIVEIVRLDQQNNVLKTGTGFFISPDGLLLRLCESCTSTWLVLRYRSYSARFFRSLTAIRFIMALAYRAKSFVFAPLFRRSSHR